MPDSTTELLQKHFDLALEAPDGITKLRELILMLAMQGKLVPQDPNDPPASELLREIEAEKKRVVKEGLTRAASKISEESSYRAPVQLPEGWSWAKLTDLGYFLGGKTPSTNNEVFWHGNIPWVSAKDMKTRLIIDSEDHVTVEGQQSGLPMIPKGSLLMVVRSGILRRTFPVAINQVQCTINQDLKALVPYMLGLSPFILTMLQAFEGFILRELSKKGVTVESITFDEFTSTEFPLPPLPEQRRIVAKIDQLMAVCDDLEKKRDALVQKRLAVHNAAIRRLLEAEEMSEFSSAWNFLVEHFGEVYSVKENVAELRKAILQLAVMGKLVRQDPSDPPASELLKEIEAEKWRLVKEGKIKASKPLPPITAEDVPYAVPSGWEWVRLGETILKMDAGWSPQCGDEPARVGEWGVLKTTSVQELQYLEFENKFLPEGLVPRPDAEVFEGDILITRAGPKNRVGICCVASVSRTRLMLSDKIIRFRLVGSTFSSRFVALSLTAGYGAMQIEESKSGMAESQVNISQVKLRQVAFAVPPVSEQHRIIDKVNQLMDHCDSLERHIEASTNQKSAILNAVLAQV